MENVLFFPSSYNITQKKYRVKKKEFPLISRKPEIEPPLQNHRKALCYPITPYSMKQSQIIICWTHKNLNDSNRSPAKTLETFREH